MVRVRTDATSLLSLISPLATAIYLELSLMGFRAWYDNRAEDLTKEGMKKGVEESAAFILFLSTGVLLRPFCQVSARAKSEPAVCALSRILSLAFVSVRDPRGGGAPEADGSAAR